jgi:cytoskeleton protein RodZ
MTLGTLLRDAREAARLSIEEVSQSTNVRVGLLREMESNNFLHCGGDTYARGHLRNIAQLIGLDPMILITAFNEEHSSEGRAIGDLLSENNAIKTPVEKKAISWKIPATFSLLILFSLGVVQIVVSNQADEIITPVVVESATPTPTPTPSPTPSAAETESAATNESAGEKTLILSAVRGNSYIDVIVDGTRIIKGSLFQGDVKTFSGERIISIYLSNPAGVDVTYNGRLLPSLGGANQEVRRTFR